MRLHGVRGRVLAVLAVAVLVLTALPLGLALGQPQSRRPADKIEPGLLDQLNMAGSGDVVVRFGRQADLSPAYRMGWRERGEFVYNSLTNVAAESQARAKTYLDGRGLKYRTFIAGNELYVWTGDIQAVTALAGLPEVDSLRLAQVFPLDDPIIEPVPDTPPVLQGTIAWGIADTKATQFWAQFGEGDGMVVANIDTGVQWTHPALVGQYKCPDNPADLSCFFDPYNVCRNSLPCDNNSHGTHTMGTMVASNDPGLAYTAGMAPHAKWIACKGCEGKYCTEEALDACADWILAPGGNPANRPHVVNNSWGGRNNDPFYMEKVIAWRAAGVFPAFSAGNGGPDCATLGSPGDYQESFASAAHGISDVISWFSSRGPSNFGHDPYTKPNISAPGRNICSTVPTDGWDCTFSGTSMASPHTAGAVALLWSCNPGLIGQIDQTFQILQNTAVSVADSSCGVPPDGQGSYVYGYGRLDVYNAGLQYCAAPTTPTPTPVPPTPTFTPVPPTATFTRTPWPTAVPATPSVWVHLPIVPRFAVPTQVPPTATFTPVTVPVKATPVPSAAVGWQTIVYEDFEGAFPGVWTVLDNNGGNYGEYYWGQRDCRPYAGSFSGWAPGGGADGASRACGADYNNDAQSWMVYGPFSLVGAGDADLSFKLWLNVEKDWDEACRMASIDGLHFYGSCATGNSRGWIDQELDLTSVNALGDLRGQPNVWVALVFSSDYSVHYPEGGYVDNILLRRYIGAAAGGDHAAPAVLPAGVYERPSYLSIQRPKQ